MALEINIQTNPLDNIVEGDTFVVPEGQLRMKGPVRIDGTLYFEDNSSLILE